MYACVIYIYIYYTNAYITYVYIEGVKRDTEVQCMILDWIILRKKTKLYNWKNLDEVFG